MNISRVKNVINEEGIAGLLRRSYKRILEPLALKIDIIFTRLLSPFYRVGFHKLFYYRFFEKSLYEKKIFWLGKEISKLPLDSWIYQEIIWELRPDVIVECGTDKGGSALYFASIFDLIGGGEVITIDINDTEVSHLRVTKIKGSSISGEIFEKVRNMTLGKKIMVVLDSHHRRDHVLKEMNLYGNLVTKNQYMVVEDGNLNGHPIRFGWGPGPIEAINKFLKVRDDFVVDKSREKFIVTFFPKGFLKKIK